MTDATNVEMLNFDLDTLEKDEIRERVVQSASMPAVFPYQVIILFKINKNSFAANANQIFKKKKKIN